MAIADVSILIVAYRSRDTLPRVMKALANQSIRPKRICVLENGSPDGERIDPASLPAEVEFTLSQVNLGFAGGNNHLAKGLDTRWIVLLNPDAFPEPDWLEHLMAGTEACPDTALFGSTQLADGAPGILDGAGDVYHVTGLPYRGGYGVEMAPPADGETFAPCGAGAMIRRDVFEALGGFDDDYFCYVEDVDLGYRARLIGHRCIQLQKAVISHMGYASSGRRSEFATYHGVRNRFWTFFKNTPLPLLVILTPLHLLATGMLWASAARFGQFTLYARALGDGLKGWSKLMKKRRDIQSSRTASTHKIAHALNWRMGDLLSRAPHLRDMQRD